MRCVKDVRSTLGLSRRWLCTGFTNHHSEHGNASIENAIQNGLGGMPAIQAVASQQDTDDIIAIWATYPSQNQGGEIPMAEIQGTLVTMVVVVRLMGELVNIHQQLSREWLCADV